MKEFLKNIIINILPEQYFEFYNKIPNSFAVIREMGPIRLSVFLISIIVLFTLYLIFNRNNIKTYFKNFNKKIFYKNHFYNLAAISIFSFLVSFIFAKVYPDTYTFFYKSTTGLTFYNPFLISFLYMLTNILFYFLAFSFFGNRNYALFSSLIWIFSSFHLMNLFSTPFRDYLKAPLFIINFFLINLILKYSKKDILNITCLASLTFSFALLFKADLLLLIPIYLFVILVHKNEKFIKNIYSIFIFIFTTYYFKFLTTSFAPDRTLQRLGGSLSNELFPFIKSYHSFSPPSDNAMFIQACALYNCNNLKTFLIYLLANFEEMILKTFLVAKSVVLLPFSYGILPDINYFISKLFFIKFSVLKNIVIIDEIYLLIVFLVPLYLSYLKKEIINIYYLIFFIYLCLVQSMPFHGRHYFYLEIFSILIFVNLIRYFPKFFYKIKNQQYKFIHANKK